MKQLAFLCLSFSIIFACNSQNSSIELINNNFFYASIDNPISFAVENTSNKSISFTVSNGKIYKKGDRYYFFTDSIGGTNITIYKKVNGKAKVIGYRGYRVKRIPNPIFKIADGQDDIYRLTLLSQQFVRAELEYFDYDVRYTIDSFKVVMFVTDSCLYIEMINKGNRLTDEIRNYFKLLKHDDIIIFKNIFVSGPGGHKEIAPRLIKIKD